MIKRDNEQVLRAYEDAKKTFAAYGVDTEQAISDFEQIPISLHNWQGDDVMGFENTNAVSQNLVTGNYPGRARNGEEMRADIDKAFSYSPVKPKVNLHSMYGEPGTTSREKVTTEDFRKWIDWAKKNGYGLDFNCSFFTHPMMNNGFSIASPDKKTRDFWIEAGKGAREIANDMARETGQTCTNNIWVPDGLKDIPANRFAYRNYLEDSLDQILEKKYDKKNVRDVLEGKLFAVGVECFTVGSHEFYLAYAATHGVGVCMDTGHYHPTESIIDKISSVYKFIDTLLLHISRGVRWDSDHVVLFDDETREMMKEVVRADALDRVFLTTDYFDASINRISAWVTGLHSVQKALLYALLEPKTLKALQDTNNFTELMVRQEELKTMPFGAVWEEYLRRESIPQDYFAEIKRYEADVLSKR